MQVDLSGMTQWDPSTQTLPAVPPPDPQQATGQLPPAGTLPSAPVLGGSLGMAEPPPQPVIPPQPQFAATGNSAQSRIPRGVRALAVIVSILKMLPFLLGIVLVVALGSEFDEVGIGALFALILLVPVLILGIQVYTALAKRRLGLQITSGIFMLLDLLWIAGSYRQGSTGLLAISVAVVIAQGAVFVGSVIDPAK